jgi:hypothetical protein
MKKTAVWGIGAGLTALALSGCAATSAASGEPTPASTVDVLTPAEVERAAIPSAEFALAVVPVLESVANDYAFFYFDSDVRPVLGFAEEAVPAVLDAVESTGQSAQIIEHAGFTHAEYRGTAEKVIDELQATWPDNVPFPMIDVRPDLGVGAIGAILVTPDGTSDAAWSSDEPTLVLEKATRLIEQADPEPPFSMEIDDKHVFGEGHAASTG